MKTVQLKKHKGGNWKYLTQKVSLNNPLVLVLGSRSLLEQKTIYKEISEFFPGGHIIFGSTGGGITSYTIGEQALAVTAIEFEKSEFLVNTASLKNIEVDSFKTGTNLIDKFPKKGLKYIFILSERNFVNPSEFTEGMNASLGNSALITGGLCGDDNEFKKSLASYNENPKEGEIVAIGFYGESLEISFSIHGGWIPFGPERVVTKSKSNILYELDGKPALSLYKKYLGDKSKKLPEIALSYPLNIKSVEKKEAHIRAIIDVNEEENTLVLAGSIQEESKAQIMMPNIDSIVNSSERVASQALDSRDKKPQLAIMINCMGRKLVLSDSAEEEVEEIINILGSDTTICGFYSEGEIAPPHGEINCQYHNQTIAVTLISE